MFSCLNRMDKYPGIFTKSLYSEEPLKLNKDFNFNISGFFCTNDNFIQWTKEEFENLRYYTPSCHSKNGRKLSGITLRNLILRDIGFRGRKHIPEDYLKL